jgi:25S rRNA (uracil2843-N3)-methyltransferase
MGKFAKNYGKVVGKDAQDRPGWKGPGYIKQPQAPPAPRARKTEEPDNDILEPAIPVELQQLLLNIFGNAFPEILASDDLKPLLQDVKAALYERDFNRKSVPVRFQVQRSFFLKMQRLVRSGVFKSRFFSVNHIAYLSFIHCQQILTFGVLGAFGKESHIQAYAIRWSPSRALCYASVLVDLRRQLAEIFPLCAMGRDQSIGIGPLAVPASNLNPTLRVICFGGGAAEVVAFGGFLRFLHSSMPHTASGSDSNSVAMTVDEELASLSLESKKAEIDLLLVDTAAWGDAVTKLHHELTVPPPLSKYASSSAKEANSALLGTGSITAHFCVQDILELSQNQISEMVGQTPTLVTLLFTLNELYTTSIGKTTTFLLNLTTAVSPGTLLLVVDSPGSYSETTIGTEARKYPMLWLLNHTLLETQKSGGKETIANWTKVVSDESQWFRLHESLRYPINLENMRYQLHLYRRI